ncbi:hypothetical protein BD410DRAFT_807645 [Rickenella mellea]|uniref:Uncharacterized protein n=1 Tax=Rickenella mellea TaxID=50990 RepID=A0A4Y7PNQ9_9AGAM|nr:hypothetical protein BD410DRAFT_807645 [Rickenella mellea]
MYITNVEVSTTDHARSRIEETRLSEPYAMLTESGVSRCPDTTVKTNTVYRFGTNTKRKIQELKVEISEVEFTLKTLANDREIVSSMHADLSKAKEWRTKSHGRVVMRDTSRCSLTGPDEGKAEVELEGDIENRGREQDVTGLKLEACPLASPGGMNGMVDGYGVARPHAWYIDEPEASAVPFAHELSELKPVENSSQDQCRATSDHHGKRQQRFSALDLFLRRFTIRPTECRSRTLVRFAVIRTRYRS